MKPTRVAEIPSDAELLAFYNTVAKNPRYQAQMYEAGHRKDFEQRIKRILSVILPFTNAVLELGCADGLISQWIAPRTEHLVGVEWAEPAIERCQALDLPNATFVNSAADDFLRGIGERYDLIVALDILEHLHDPFETIGCMQDFTDHILASVPINEHPNPDAFSIEQYHNPLKIGDGSGHIWSFRSDSFQALFDRVWHYEDNGVTAIVLGI